MLTSGPPLSPQTRKRVDLLFGPEERNEAARLSVEQCGNNLPFLETLDEYRLERFRFAALKLSGGNLQRLHDAMEIAKRDWRDLLIAAGFAHDVNAHVNWLPITGAHEHPKQP